jgi:hypothetical protein
MKARYVAVGVCPNCGKEFVRPPICTAAACDCSSVTEVPLHPAVILPSRLHAKLKKVADMAGVSITDFVNAMIKEAAERKLKELKITYEL